MKLGSFHIIVCFGYMMNSFALAAKHEKSEQPENECNQRIHDARERVFDLNKFCYKGPISSPVHDCLARNIENAFVPGISIYQLEARVIRSIPDAGIRDARINQAE